MKGERKVNIMDERRKVITAQIQSPLFNDIHETEANLRRRTAEAVNKGADLVMLPEMFYCPYATEEFPQRAEPEGGPMWQFCSALAAEYKVYLAAGSMPEIDTESGRHYNTAYVFDRSGRQIAKHRKMHLFDINVKGGQRFMESETLSAGDQITVFDTDFGKIGLCICYDIRFTELVRLMALKGAEIVLVPAAFNMTTGPAHWELTLRAQAAFNQVYVLGTSTARDMSRSYHAWGHTIAVDSWGNVKGQLDENEGILVTDIDLTRIYEIREQLPLLKHRRTDIYDVIEIKPENQL